MSAPQGIQREPKRLIMCCDGTWMDSDDGYIKPTLAMPTATLQIPSNVTRISRALRKTGLDGRHQIVYYQSGVGTGSTFDTITGGLLGTGISENIREVYSFVTTNYSPGDEIILVGFSRGAFTARSVAGLINGIGLLTREGMNDFYPIFKDQENFHNHRYHDRFPTIPFPNKPHGDGAEIEYKMRLEQDGLTRVFDPDGRKIRVHAVAVWDTVGSLGIPQLSLFAKLGFPHSSKEYKFYDTDLNDNIIHAFQALALDEHRAPFNAAVWERKNRKELVHSDLRQVWFPGAHANVGGGYDDQEMANITLAWMMDQLASIGVAFMDEYIDQMFEQNVQYFENLPDSSPAFSNKSSRSGPQWAIDSVYDKHQPVRPWGLGKIWNSETSYYHLTGTKYRTPGLNKRADPDSGKLTDIPMRNTNERIHSCVRIRLDLGGLGEDDKGPYKAHALQDRGWELTQIRLDVRDPIPYNATWGPSAPPSDRPPSDVRWVWEYHGSEKIHSRDRIMVEEPLGPYERKLLLLNRGRKFYKNVRKRRKHKSSRQTSSAFTAAHITTAADQEATESLIEDRRRDRRSRYRDHPDETPSRARPERRSRIIEPVRVSENDYVSGRDSYTHPPAPVPAPFAPPPPRYESSDDEIVVIEEHDGTTPLPREQRRGSRVVEMEPRWEKADSDIVVITEDARREDRQKYSEKINERFRDEGYGGSIGREKEKSQFRAASRAASRAGSRVGSRYRDD